MLLLSSFVCHVDEFVELDSVVLAVEILAGGGALVGVVVNQALVVGQVDEAIVAEQALFPWQHPALAQHAVDFEIVGVEA